MVHKALDHFESYEWTGLFWFPESEDNKFSGTVRYSPESGIQLELLTMEFSDSEKFHKKLLHGAVTGEVTNSISLLNVSLDMGTMHSGQSFIRVHRGTAGYLLQGFLVNELTFESLDLQYEEQFENIFFTPAHKERQIIAYENTQAMPDKDTKISMSMNWQGAGMYTEEDIATTFWSRNEEKYKEFKAAMAGFLEDDSFKLHKRTSLFPIFKIEKPNSSLQELFTVEDKWRAFWEFLTDRELFPKNIWLKIEYTMQGRDTIFNEMVPLLRNYYKPIRTSQKRSAFIFQYLPINMMSFGDTWHDLSVIDSAITKWFTLKNNPDWNPVMYGLARILRRKRRLAETPHYIGLVAEIQIFLNLLNKEPENLNTFIDAYATEEWKASLFKLLPLQQKETLGKFLSDIRNAIVHPKGAAEKYKRQLSIIHDLHLFQKIFAHLAGLYVQAILQELGSISSDSISKYVKQFIDARGSWHTIDYV